MMTLVELKALLETRPFDEEDGESELLYFINRYLEKTDQERQVELGRLYVSPDEHWNQMLEIQSLEERLSALLRFWNANYPDEACLLPGEEV